MRLYPMRLYSYNRGCDNFERKTKFIKVSLSDIIFNRGYDDINEWCNENIGETFIFNCKLDGYQAKIGGPCWFQSFSSFDFFFKYEEDAVLFALKWSEFVVESERNWYLYPLKEGELYSELATT